MTDLEKEVGLLREKVKLLEKIKELNEIIGKQEQPPVYVPYPYLVYPSIPRPYWGPYYIPYTTGDPAPLITWEEHDSDGATTTGIWNVPTVWTNLESTAQMETC